MDYKSLISKNTVSFLLSQFPAEAPAWLDAFNDNTARLMDRWQVTCDGYESDSRFGAIFYGNSATYGRVCVKLIPWFCGRLNTEILCYEKLRYPEMCALYDTDTETGALLLRKVDNSNDENTKISVFKRLHLSMTPACDGFPLYSDVVTEVLNGAEKIVSTSDDPKLRLFLPSIERSLELLPRFMNADIRTTHGDIHGANMLTGNGSCVLIDPLGYRAPFEQEYARYAGSAVKFDDMDVNRFGRLIWQMLPEGADVERVLDAFAIDTTLRGCNTFIEGNTPDEIRQGAGWAQRAFRLRDEMRAVK